MSEGKHTGTAPNGEPATGAAACTGSVIAVTCGDGPDFPIISISATVEERLGISPRAFLDEPGLWRRHIHLEDRDSVAAALESIAETGRASGDFRFRGGDGEYRWLRAEWAPAANAGDSRAAILGNWIDITDLKRAASHWRTLVESNPLPCAVTALADGSIIYANQPYADIFGESSREDVIGKSAVYYYAEAKERAALRDRLVRDGSVAGYEIRLRRVDKSELWAIVSVRRFELDGEPVIFGTFLDVSDRKAVEVQRRQQNEALERRVEERTESLRRELEERQRAEAALRESEERFKDFADAASDWQWETDENFRFTEFSGLRPLGPGVDADLSIARTREEIADSDDDPEKWRRHRADIEARRPYSNFQYRRVDENGKVFHLRVSGKPLFDSAGSFQGYRGVGSDITALVEAEQRAHSAQERLAIAMDGIPESIVLYDREDKLIIANRACRELNEAIVDTLRPGSRFEDRMRAAVRAGLYPEAIGREEAWLGERLEQHRDPSGPVEVARQDGRRFLVHEQRLADGGTFTSAAEITELKLAEAALSESEERFRKVAQSAREAIISVDRRARIVFWNNGATTMFGYTPDEIDKKSFFMLAPERHRADHRDLFAKVGLGDPAGLIGNTVEGKGLRKDGSEFPLEISYSEWTLGGATYYTAIIRDVTARKLAEKELRLAKEAADSANRAKSDFLSSMSHELRNPLNAILGFGQLLELGGDTALDENQKEYVGHIIRSGRHLLSLINDILDLSKIEAGKIDLILDDVPVETVLAQCVELVELDARARGIEISIPEAASVPLLVHADATRVRQALLNLLSNAVKYNKDGGGVRVTFAAPSNGMLRISVADTGQGIAESSRGEVFQPFSRLGAEQSEIEGTGIGLTVTKRIVEEMGGHIDFESEVGVGSTFWIELPVAGEP